MIEPLLHYLATIPPGPAPDPADQRRRGTIGDKETFHQYAMQEEVRWMSVKF